jgi:hypothetical protein
MRSRHRPSTDDHQDPTSNRRGHADPLQRIIRSSLVSRRHHGRPHHRARGAPDIERRPAAPNTGPVAGISPGRFETSEGAAARRATASAPAAPSGPVPPTPADPAIPAFVPHPQTVASHNGAPHHTGSDRNGQCTAPQLRRFIKSRPYVPMHELRRRFGIDGADDDVTGVRLDPGWVYVGLPSREGGLLGELLQAGEIGYELSLDPRSPIVIGVYPMRPIPRS